MDAAAAYEFLHALTKDGSHGRASLEVIRELAYPDEYATKRAAEKNHCPYCFSWKGGPMVCCEDGYMNRDKLPAITEAEAKAQRLPPTTQKEPQR